MEQPREVPTEQEVEQEKPKQQEKTSFSVKLLIAGLVVLVILVSALYSFRVAQGNREAQAWSQMMAKLENKNDRLQEQVDSLQVQIEERATRIDALEQDNEKLQRKLENAQIALNNPWINGTILATFSTPTDINQIVTPIVIDFPEGLLFNTTVIQGETLNRTILWTGKEITEFEGEIRYNVTRLPNPDVPSLHTLFSEYQAPKEAEPYLRKTSEFTWTDEELNELMSLIDANDTLRGVLIKTLDYANEHKEPSSNPCYMASLKATGLLRAVGIPTRMVGGSFAGGPDINRLNQTSSHGWVQAYLDGYWLDYNANSRMNKNKFVNRFIINHKTTAKQFSTEFNQHFTAKTIVRGKAYYRMMSEHPHENSFTYVVKLKYPSEDVT